MHRISLHNATPDFAEGSRTPRDFLVKFDNRDLITEIICDKFTLCSVIRMAKEI